MRYSVKAASMATGVSASSLRTWERRYGLPNPKRSASGRRLYDEEDLATIRRMAALVAAGNPPSEAAVAAKEEGLMHESPPLSEEAQEHPLAVSIRHASAEYDEVRSAWAIHEAVSSLGWAAALDHVLMPALRSIGRSWRENTIISANEHFTSEMIRREIAAALVDMSKAGPGASAVLLACPADERHELGLLGLCLLLRKRRIATVYLGADVPTPDLLLAARRTGIAAICLSATTWSGLASLARATREIAGDRVPVLLFVGGPAIRQATDEVTVLGVTLPQSLAAAAELIVERLSRGVKK